MKMQKHVDNYINTVSLFEGKPLLGEGEQTDEQKAAAAAAAAAKEGAAAMNDLLNTITASN